jgi:hypothetical protein
MRWKRAAKPLVAVAVGGTLLVWGAGAAMAGPGAPGGVTVSRTAGNAFRATLSWMPVEGAAKYFVSVFDGTRDTVTVVPAGTTSMTVDVADACKRWRFNVAARDASGKGTVSRNVWLDRAGSGPVEGLRATRTGADVTVTWETPSDTGAGPITGYSLSASGEGYYTNLWPGGHAVVLPNVPASARLTVRMTASNGFPSCGPQAQTVLPAAVAAAVPEPTGLTAKKDPADPRHFLLNWKAPTSTEHGAVTGYTVLYGYYSAAGASYRYAATNLTKVDVAAGTSTAIDLPASWPETTGSVQFAVNAVFADGYRGGDSPPVYVGPPVSAAATATPKVAVDHTFGRIHVELDREVGDYAAYPNAVVRISRADGYSTEQWMDPGTRELTVYDIPQGRYTVAVNGVSELGEEEWSRTAAQVAGDMAITTGDWQPGAPWTDAEQTGRSNIVTREPLRGQDQGLAYDIDTSKFSAERGYGAMLRAADNGKGLVLRYEPRYTTTVDGQTLVGPGFSLTNTRSGGGAGCATRLAGAFAPPGTFELGEHRVTLRAWGNTFTATVDGRTVLEVADLRAVYGAGCTTDEVPAGAYAGLHVWQYQLENYQRDWTAMHYSGTDPYSNLTLTTTQ